MRLITKVALSGTINNYDGLGTYSSAIKSGLQPDPSLPLDDWSQRYMVIPRSTGAAEYGKYRLERTPHAREIMKCLSVRHPCRRVVLMAASQMLKTQLALNWFCYIVHQHPSNFVWLMPTGKLHKRIVQRIDRVIDAVDVVKPRVSPPGSRQATNSQDIKVFQGGTLYIATAGSAANLAEVPARYVSFDEIDRAELSVDGEGDPVKLAEARQTTFANTAKSYFYSSPTIENESRIASLYDEGTQREAMAECIHCGHAQPLVFGNLVRGEGGTAMYPCSECGGLHYDYDKLAMFKGGLWSESKQQSKTESFHISAMFQPYGWFSWTDLMNQYDEAKEALARDQENEMIVFDNTRLARVWKRTNQAVSFDALKERSEDIQLRFAPHDVLLITAGVDTQDYRLAVQIVGWGRYLKAIPLDYVELYGDPVEADVWNQLTNLLNRKIMHASGHELSIVATAIDTGGHRGEAVKNYVRSKRIQCPIAIFGATKLNAQPLSKGSMQDVRWSGVYDKKGVMIHAVGTVEIKHVIFSRLAKDSGKEPEQRSIRFSNQFDDGYFAGIVSETYDNNKKRYIKKPGARNEPLDTLVYAYAALHHSSIRAHRFTEKDWKSIEIKLANPVTKSLEMLQQKEYKNQEPVTEKPKNQALSRGKSLMSNLRERLGGRNR